MAKQKWERIPEHNVWGWQTHGAGHIVECVRVEAGRWEVFVRIKGEITVIWKRNYPTEVRSDASKRYRDLATCKRAALRILAAFERQANADFSVTNHGSLFALRPLTDAGRQWCDEHLPEDAQTLGASFMVEHRYIDPILEGIAGDGLVFR